MLSKGDLTEHHELKDTAPKGSSMKTLTYQPENFIECDGGDVSTLL